jgi:hypothetical protein
LLPSSGLATVLAAAVAAREPSRSPSSTRVRAPFKKAPPARTSSPQPEDSACTILIDSGRVRERHLLQYYIDKSRRSKAARPPKAVRIRAIIDAPTAPLAPYLRVTKPASPPHAAKPAQAGNVMSGTGPQGCNRRRRPQGAQGPQGMSTAGHRRRRPQGAQGDVGRRAVATSAARRAG